MSKLGHLPSLDGLRGLAILMVIAHNVQLLEAPHMEGGVKAAYFLLNIGWIGVLLFFVLSGFLITGILLDTLDRPHALRHFLTRRALRIFPLYYGALLVIFVLLPSLGLQPDLYRAQAPYQGWLWVYLSNWTDPLGIGPGALGHFWSLAVEEQFYLFWPLLVFAARTPAAVARVSVMLALAAMASRALMVHNGVDANVVYSWTHCRLDALALGALAAACWRIPACVAWLKSHVRSMLAIVALLFVFGGVLTRGFPRTSELGMAVGYGVLALTFTALIALAVWHDRRASRSAPAPALAWWHRLLRTAPLQGVGKYSYGMYVIHKPLHDLLSIKVLAALNVPTAGLLLNAGLHVLAMMLLSFSAAWLSYHLFEVHFLNLKRHFA